MFKLTLIILALFFPGFVSPHLCKADDKSSRVTGAESRDYNGTTPSTETRAEDGPLDARASPSKRTGPQENRRRKPEITKKVDVRMSPAAGIRVSSLRGRKEKPASTLSALLWLPRLLLWPLRAAFELITRPGLAILEWGEKSGVGDWTSRIISSKDGRFYPFFNWTLHKRPHGGVHIAVPIFLGNGLKGKLRSAAWGGGGIWGGFAGFSLQTPGRFRLTLEGTAWDRDDGRLRLPATYNLKEGWIDRHHDETEDSSRRELIYRRRHAHAGLSVRHRFTQWLAVDVGLFYTHECFGPTNPLKKEELITKTENQLGSVHPKLWVEPYFSGLTTHLGVLLGNRGWMNAWQGSTIKLRRRKGFGAVFSISYFHDLPGGEYRTLLSRGEAWWTWRVPGGKGWFTTWAGIKYLSDLGRAPVPPPLWIHMGGLSLLRGMQEGSEIGTSGGFASVEYTHELLKDLFGSVFLDWGQASNRRFETWRWSMDMVSMGARIEYEIIKEWIFYIQAGVSRDDRVAGIGIGKRS